MDPLGNNKIFASLLGAVLVFLLIRSLPEFLMHHGGPDVPAYVIGDVESEGDDEPVELPFPQAEWVAAMDATRGAAVFKKCVSCHNVEAGGANGTGPALHDVVNRMAGAVSDYSYSGSMASAGYAWDFEHLDGFLEKPKKYLPGTKMAFVGLKKPEDRAAVIEYLRVNAASPAPRPEAVAMAPTEVELTATAEDATGEAEGGLAVQDPVGEGLGTDDNIGTTENEMPVQPVDQDEQ